MDEGMREESEGLGQYRLGCAVECGPPPAPRSAIEFGWQVLAKPKTREVKILEGMKVSDCGQFSAHHRRPKEKEKGGHVQGSIPGDQVKHQKGH